MVFAIVKLARGTVQVGRLCVLVSLPILIAGMVGHGEEASAQQRPNVVVIVADDLGYADLSAYAHHAPDVRTPNLDRLARGGVRFQQAYATGPVCSPSRAGWNTGRYPFRWDEDAGWRPGLPEEAQTLAEYLKEAGYTTARFGKNDYGGGFQSHQAREYPLNHGYGEFLGFSAHAHDFWLLSDKIARRTPDPNGHSAHLGPLMHNEGTKSFADGYTTEIFTDAAIDFVERRRENSFFVTLSYNAVHHLIHEVPDEYLEMYGVEPVPNYDPDRGLAFGEEEAGSYAAYYKKYNHPGSIPSEEMRQYYLANLRCLDDNVGRFLDALDRLGLSDNTLLIFFSDNGGSALTAANNAPLTGAKNSLHEGGIRVPLIMRWPGRVSAGETYEHPVSTLDVLPTSLAAAGASRTASGLDGVNLLEPLQTGEPANRRGAQGRIMIWRWKDTFAIRKGDWKLTNVGATHFNGEPSHLYLASRYTSSKVRLFNLQEDPGEKVDVAEEHSDVAMRLKALYDEWYRENTGKH